MNDRRSFLASCVSFLLFDFTAPSTTIRLGSGNFSPLFFGSRDYELLPVIFLLSNTLVVRDGLRIRKISHQIFVINHSNVSYHACFGENSRTARFSSPPIRRDCRCFVSPFYFYKSSNFPFYIRSNLDDLNI